MILTSAELLERAIDGDERVVRCRDMLGSVEATRELQEDRPGLPSLSNIDVWKYGRMEPLRTRDVELANHQFVGKIPVLDGRVPVLSAKQSPVVHQKAVL